MQNLIHLKTLHMTQSILDEIKTCLLEDLVSNLIVPYLITPYEIRVGDWVVYKEHIFLPWNNKYYSTGNVKEGLVLKIEESKLLRSASEDLISVGEFRYGFRKRIIKRKNLTYLNS